MPQKIINKTFLGKYERNNNIRDINYATIRFV